MTLFIISTLEGWPDIMYYFIDGSDAETVYFLILTKLIKGSKKRRFIRNSLVFCWFYSNWGIFFIKFICGCYIIELFPC